MTKEEYIEIMDKSNFMLDSANPYDMEIKEALEKQIPKKVIHYHHCPQCDGGLPTEGITEDYCKCCFKWKYCPNCGQAIKWE